MNVVAACPEGKFPLPRVRKRNKERRFKHCGKINVLHLLGTLGNQAVIVREDFLQDVLVRQVL